MSQISKVIAKHIGPTDNPEMRERLEELERSSIFRLYRARLQADLERVRKQNDDERDPVCMYRNQGAIGKLNLALDLPTRMYKEVGGKRDLFTGEVPVAEETPGNYVAAPTLSELFPGGRGSIKVVREDADRFYCHCSKHGPYEWFKNSRIPLSANAGPMCPACPQDNVACYFVPPDFPVKLTI